MPNRREDSALVENPSLLRVETARRAALVAAGRLGDPGGSRGSKARPAVCAGHAPWKGPEGDINTLVLPEVTECHVIDGSPSFPAWGS